MRCRRLVATFMLTVMLTAQLLHLAHAWAFLAAPATTAVLWLGRFAAANVSRAQALEWSIYLHGALVSTLWWSNQGTSTTNGSISDVIPAEIVLGLSPTAKRDNPDPAKWDYSSPDARDVTPKASIPSSAGPWGTSAGAVPSSYTSINASMTSGSVKQWTNANGTPAVFYKVTNTSNSSVQPGFLKSTFAPVASGSFTIGDIVYSKQTSIAGANSSYDHIYAAGVASTASATRALTTGDLYGCSIGYSYNTTSGACALTDASLVNKPAGTPCEVLLMPDGSFTTDSKNPTCALVNAKLNASGPTLRVTRGLGDEDAITPRSDGGITVDTKSATGNRRIELGPHDAGAGGRPIQSITTSPPGSTSTNGGASCGGTGQTKCSIDDSGFVGKEVSATAATTAIEKQTQDYQSRVNANNNDHGIGWDQLIPDVKFGAGNVACTPLVVDLSHLRQGMSIPLDPCNNELVQLLRQAEAFALYVFTVYYIWRRFTRSEQQE